MAEEYVNPIEVLIHSTVRIECETESGRAYGSGYFFGFLQQENQNVPCIVTNKHVVAGAKRGTFHLTRQDAHGKPVLGEYIAFSFENFEQQWIGHPDSSIDLAIFLLGPLLNQANSNGEKFHYASLGKSTIAGDDLLSTLPTMEEIIMIGYPIGIWDQKHNLPIIRRGITATHPKLPYNGKPEFLIDAACFPGSSGSPVFLANIGSYVDVNGALCAGTRIALLGTLYAGPQHAATGEVVVVNVPTDTKSLSVSNIPTNLGLVIHASKLLDFEPVLQAMLDSQSSN